MMYVLALLMAACITACGFSIAVQQHGDGLGGLLGYMAINAIKKGLQPVYATLFFQ